MIQLLADRLKRSEAIEAGLLSKLYVVGQSLGAREILERADDIWRLKALPFQNEEEEEED